MIGISTHWYRIIAWYVTSPITIITTFDATGYIKAIRIIAIYKTGLLYHFFFTISLKRSINAAPAKIPRAIQTNTFGAKTFDLTLNTAKSL